MGRTIMEILKKPSLLFMTLGHRELFNWMDDERYIRRVFKITMGKDLNLEDPKTYSEKLQWMKLYDRNPLYTSLVDKHEVKSLIAAKIGPEFIIPTLGVWDDFDEIDFEKLPDRFVLKCTHDSGGLVICKDKGSLNVDKIKKKINKCLKHSYFWGDREWPYKNIRPRIIAEQYMEDSQTKELRDYKFFCFNGVVKALFIATDRYKGEHETKFDFFDENYNHLPFTNGHPNADVIPQKPKCFEEMKRIAAVLSEGIPQVRVDLYEVDGKVYFGEMTFFHWSGHMPFEPEEWDYIFGSWIDLPKKNKMIK